MERLGIAVGRGDPWGLEAVKEREAVGHACEAADASFELLPGARSGRCCNFDVSQFDINVEQRVNAIGECG